MGLSGSLSGGGGSGGSKPAPKRKKEGNFFSRLQSGVASDLRQFWSAAPQIPGFLAKEGAELAAIVRRGKSYEGKTIGGGKNASEFLQSPGIRLIPGTYVGSNIAKGKAGRTELGNHPLFTTLDVLPIAGKVSKAATRGTSLAAEASQRAAAAGKLAKAAKIAEEGLEPRQLTKIVAQRAEDALAKKYPKLENVMPTRALERTGKGGERVRSLMEVLNVQNRKFAKDLKTETDDIFAKAKESGLDDNDVQRLTHAYAEGKPGWRDTLTEPEKAFTAWYETKNADLAQRGIAEGKLFRWNKEVYSAADNPNLTKAVRAYNRNLERAAKSEARIAAGKKPARNQRTPEEYAQLAEKARVAADEISARTAPARFKTAMQPQLREKVLEVVRKRSEDMTEQDFDAIVHYLDEGGPLGGVPKLTPKDVQRITRNLNQTWQKLRAEGYDPVFVHQVSPDQAKRLMHPSIEPERLLSPSQVKRRAWEQRSWVQDVQVALSHQAMEWLQRHHTQAFVDELVNRNLLLSGDEVMERIRMKATAGAGRGKDLGARMEDLLEREFDVFDPATLFPGRGLTIRTGERMYLPKGLGRALDQMKPGPFKAGAGKIGGAMMNVFRTSVLTLNPFYYIDNLLSGAMMLMSRADPSALKFAPAAVKLIRNGEVPVEIARGASMAGPQKATAAYHYAAGRTIGRIIEENPSAVRRLANYGGAGKTALEGLANAIDDMYKTMSYLYGQNKALRRGMPKEVAHSAGIELAHKVLLNFDRFTPFERTIVRSVFPFYSWSKFLMGYVFSYPFDHPVRASILASISRQTLEDWQSELPQRFWNYMFLGKPNAEGNVTALPMSGMNPMLGSANYFTLAGIVSRVDPRAGAVLEYLGVDPMTQGAELYPNVTFDPVSGRETFKRPEAGRIAADSIFPQVGALWEVVQTSEEMRKLRESNPDAFARRIASAFGIRTRRTFNVPEELEKQAEAQERVIERQEREAARSGGGSSGGGGLAGSLG